MPEGKRTSNTDPQSPAPPAETTAPNAAAARNLRLRRVQRDQVTPVPARLDALLPEDHLARLIWHAVTRLDLSAFYAGLEVEEGGRGQAATDPMILVALWLYATSQGVTSARALARLCVEHLAYLWLFGGISMNYHTLSDFRVRHGAALDALLTQVLGHLIHAGLVEFEHTAQDGMRVRASAGAASFHRQGTLEKALEQAQALVAALEAPNAAATEPSTPREEGARKRAARERVERLEAALGEMPVAQAAKPEGEREKARVSSTDPEARVMKMADGGFRPAYNWQFAVDTAYQVITGVDVVNIGSYKAQMPPMIDQVEGRCGQLPDDWLMDGGFVSAPAIEAGTAQGVRILAPVPKPKDATRDPHVPLASDSPVMGAWRERMGTGEAKATYKLRAATAECVNGQSRTCYNVQQVRVRGLAKVLCVARWVAITHDLLIWLKHWALLMTPPAACGA